MKNTLNYKIIKSKKQYFEYCKKLKILLDKNLKKHEDEIELLTLLIENGMKNSLKFQILIQ